MLQRLKDIWKYVHNATDSIRLALLTAVVMM